MVELYLPALEELWFKKELLSEPDTMSYNHAWGGTIDFAESAWADWYARWVCPGDGTRFYRYLRDTRAGRFVGEASYHWDETSRRWMVDVLISARERNKGLGRAGLALLCGSARERGIPVLYDSIAADNPAVRLFLDCGFIEVDRTPEVILVKKEL